MPEVMLPPYSNNQQVCRLTFKVGDVFAARISEPKSHKSILTRLLGSQGSKNVGGGLRESEGAARPT